MYIAKLQIQDYKSYLASEEIGLTPGFNVIVGQNNAGKTALVEALSLRFDSKLHMSMTTSPERGILFTRSVSLYCQDNVSARRKRSGAAIDKRKK